MNPLLQNREHSERVKDSNWMAESAHDRSRLYVSTGRRIILRVYKSCNGNKGIAQAVSLLWPFFAHRHKPALAAHMLRPSLALLILCFSCALAQAQSFAHRERTPNQTNAQPTTDQVVASQAILLLKRLDDQVIVYRSLGEFEEGRRLARVPLATFQRNLREVSAGVEELASHLPQGNLKSEIQNALASYRDGAYWWERAEQPRVIHVSQLQPTETPLTSSDSFFAGSLPYTIAIHWRQANKHLRRAARHIANS